MKKVLSLIILATSALIAQPESNVPSNMSFQGLLTDTEGIAYDDGEYQLTFRLIREMNDGTEQTVWEESHLTNVSNGVFSVVLGSVNPLPLNISPNVLLETQVGDEILSPRQPLTSVPFALKSSRSQQAYQSVLSDTANFAHNAQLATHADTANFVMNLPMVDSVQFSFNAYHSQLSDTAMVSLNAPMADTAQFAYNSQHATHSDSAMFTANSQHATHADTAQFLINMPAIDSVMFAEQAHHSMYADTAQFVAQAQSALTSLTSENSTNSVYADTAIFVDLSQYNGNVNIDGTVTATSFTGDGSGLTGITTELTGYGEKFLELTLNLQEEQVTIIDIDEAFSITNNWVRIDFIEVIAWDEIDVGFHMQLEFINDYNNLVEGVCEVDYFQINPQIDISNERTGRIHSYSSNSEHNLRAFADNRDVSLTLLCKVTSNWD